MPKMGRLFLNGLHVTTSVHVREVYREDSSEGKIQVSEGEEIGKMYFVERKRNKEGPQSNTGGRS